eukprot:TRINITY_DN6117_c0_g1_i1.p1 TRINITY_DN6117_c0_g1~~TRINITY_DN6117_c0_g1_i1.p1  ORF type:complete len:667 (+),score=215.84 TRINITY_DN6117_c0_g1_i1:54-2003(+)
MVLGTISREGKAYETDPTKVLLRGDAESWERFKPMTLTKKFDQICDDYGSCKALWQSKDGKDRTWTYDEYRVDVRKAAKSLIHLGLKQHEVVLVMGFNSPEWVIGAVAAITAGGIEAGVYATNSIPATEYQVTHSKSPIALCEDEKQTAKFLDIRKRGVGNLKHIVQWGGTLPEGEENVHSWEQFLAMSDNISDSELKDRSDASEAGNAACLIYTSGTTGNPKAVMISHDNIVYTSDVLTKEYETAVVGQERLLSFLPLSHVAAQILDIFGNIYQAGCTCFAGPDVLKKLVPTLKNFEPTIFFGVPRVWEKIEEAMREAGRDTAGLKKSLVDWAKTVGTASTNALQNKTPLPWGFWLANNLVLWKVRVALGLHKTKKFFTGAAPIKRGTLDYFASLNIPVMEVFGMSECTGPETINSNAMYKIGSCGPGFVDDVHDLTIMDPDSFKEGEVCWKGRHVMMGYMYDEEKTAEAIDSKGYLHSGDIGTIDKEGFLFITGRKKELIITAGGENIPPVIIEGEIKKELDAVSNAMVVGDQQKYLVVLITLKTNPDPATGLPSKELSAIAKRASGSTANTVAEAQNCDVMKKYIEEGIKMANTRATSNAQKVQYFRILPEDFTEPGGELTPTLKLKRKQALKKWETYVQEMYPDQ